MTMLKILGISLIIASATSGAATIADYLENTETVTVQTP